MTESYPNDTFRTEKLRCGHPASAGAVVFHGRGPTSPPGNHLECAWCAEVNLLKSKLESERDKIIKEIRFALEIWLDPGYGAAVNAIAEDYPWIVQIPRYAAQAHTDPKPAPEQTVNAPSPQHTPLDAPLPVLDDYQVDVHNVALLKGWWDTNRNLFEAISEVHCELSEALAELRKNPDPSITYYDEKKKPCGFRFEVADAILRLLDMMEHEGLSTEQAMIEKHRYNTTRPYRHGKA